MANDMTPLGLEPICDITRFLEGRSRAHGFFEDRFGRVRRRFQINLHGAWSGRDFVLSEDIDYDDGESERRVWRILKHQNGRFTATTEDCLGTAHGESSSHDWRMRFRFKLRRPRGRPVTVTFDDRVTLVDRDLALSRATLRKWGIRIGEVVAIYDRSPSRAA